MKKNTSILWKIQTWDQRCEEEKSFDDRLQFCDKGEGWFGRMGVCESLCALSSSGGDDNKQDGSSGDDDKQDGSSGGDDRGERFNVFGWSGLRERGVWVERESENVLKV